MIPLFLWAFAHCLLAAVAWLGIAYFIAAFVLAMLYPLRRR